MVPSASNYKIFTDPSTGSKYAEFLLEDQYAYSHKVVLDLDRWNDFTWISKSRSYSISIPKNYDLLNSQAVLNLFSRYLFWLSEIDPEESEDIPNTQRLENYLRYCQTIYIDVIQDVLNSRNLKFLGISDKYETLVTDLKEGYFHLNIQERYLELCFNQSVYIISTPNIGQHRINTNFLNLLEDYTHMLFDDLY